MSSTPKIAQNMSSSKSIVPNKISANSIIASLSKISISQMGSSLAGLMFVLATVQQFCPNIVNEYLKLILMRLSTFFRPQIQITFYEYTTYSFRTSDAYRVIEAYIGMLSMDASNNATRLKGDKADKKSSTQSLVFVLEDYEEIVDKFDGIEFTWMLGKLQPKTKSFSHCPWSAEKRYFMLTFKKKYRRLATAKYLKHVMEVGEAVIKQRRTRMLYTNNPSTDWEDNKRGIWRKTVFEHPAKFDNLAMDPIKKDEVIQDLMVFSKANDFYKKIAKAWKRGYLLHGPPGTGKTTMIACMANLLGYDIYDLELTAVKTNSELRNLLISTTGKSIILIEDIDCTLPITTKRQTSDEKNSDDDDEKTDSGDSNSEEVKNKETETKTKVTLSGLLNIIDGLWSPCSEERIIVFTTNHIDKLDPALIRAGRMDKHIEMSYCTFEAFKIFAKNYLNIEYHPLFDRIKTLLSESNVTPCDVAENLLPKSLNEDPSRRLEELISAIEEKTEKERVKSSSKLLEENKSVSGNSEKIENT